MTSTDKKALTKQQCVFRSGCPSPQKCTDSGYCRQTEERASEKFMQEHKPTFAQASLPSKQHVQTADIEACFAWLVQSGNPFAASHQMAAMLHELLERRRADETKATPVSWRYKDARGHWRYTGSEPKPEHAILKAEPLYAHPSYREVELFDGESHIHRFPEETTAPHQRAPNQKCINGCGRPRQSGSQHCDECDPNSDQ